MLGSRLPRSGPGTLASALVALFVAMMLVSAAAMPQTPVGATETARLRVMTFNIFYGGDELNLRNRNWCYHPQGCPETFDKVVEAIRESGADVVGLQEPAMKTRILAERLGWHHDERMHVISRYPLVDPPGADGSYTFVEAEPGKVAAIANTHLPADPYGPYEFRDGAAPGEVREVEEIRRAEIERYLERLEPLLADADVPLFFTGDFNSPSHLDWTEATAAQREVVVPFEWPVSVALAEAGLRDSYREVHPDPVETPGFTWTPGGPESVRDEVHDRIDWVLAAGPVSAQDSEILGEANGPDVDIEVDPYPSDHRGVVSTFDVELADMPTLVAVAQRRVEAGDPLEVRFNGAADRVAIVAAGNDEEERAQSTSGTSGELAFDTAGLAPDAYEALLVGSDDEVLARAPFWVVEPGATPTVRTDKDVYAVGEPIEVTWEDAYGMRLDWFGIYSPGHNHTSPHASTCTTWPCGSPRYLLYEYLGAQIEGTTTFGPDSRVGWGSWPLSPGTYEIRLLLDDHYRSAASSERFRVVR